MAQSLYVKEKGYGMGKYSGHITNILAGQEEKVKLAGRCLPRRRKILDALKLGGSA